MMILILKLALVPALIALVTLSGRKYGPQFAGWLSAFPVVAGPILFFITLEHGPAFAAQSAVATLTAVLAILVFGLSYAWTATRWTWPICIALSMLSYATSVWLLSIWAASLLGAVLIVALVLSLVTHSYPSEQHIRAALQLDHRAANDLPYRMAIGAALVWVVTSFSAAMGPRLSGLLAMFPVMGSVLVVFPIANLALCL
jgi:hypothetical protein